MARKRSEGVRSSATIRVGVLGLLAAVLLALPLAVAPRAEAYVYWVNDAEIGPLSAIARANLDGSGVNSRFIDSTGHLGGIAVDADHVYWSTADSGIARANLDGTGVNRSFITGIDSFGLAVDASHVYWTDSGTIPSFSDAGIGRADLDGSGVDPNFINSPSPVYYPPIDVAVDSDHVYWSQTFNPPNGKIGRANLDGTGVDQSFINAANSPAGLTVDARHVYWTNYYTGKIGRARLDGTRVDQSFISVRERVMSDVAVDAKHVYWAQAANTDPRLSGLSPHGRIGRADLDGTNVDQDFVSLGGHEATFLAVDALTADRVAGEASAPKTQRQRDTRIVVKVRVKAKERLTAKATGTIKVNPTYKLRPKKIRLAARQAKTLRLKPRKKAAGKIARALKRGEKATARLTVKLTDRAGNTETEKLRVRLKR